MFVCYGLHQLLGDTSDVSIEQNTQLHWQSHLWSRGMSSSCCKSGRYEAAAAVVIAKGAMLQLIGFLTDMLTFGHFCVSQPVCMCCL